MADEQKQKAKPEKVKLVKMVNDEGKEADVHPDMVNDYIKGGYKVK